MSGSETWFEVKVECDLAVLLQRIVSVYSRVGHVKRAELLGRLDAAIPGRAQSHERDDLVAACRVMAVMLRGEYGCLPVAEIVRTWGVSDPFADGPVTDADADAVARIEHLLAPVSRAGQTGREGGPS